MPAILVVFATSSQSVRAVERCDWLDLPSNEDAIKRILSNMLSVDSWLRIHHEKLMAEGYASPLGRSGCRAWIVRMLTNDIVAELDIRKAAATLEDIVENGEHQMFQYDAETALKAFSEIILAIDLESAAGVEGGNRVVDHSAPEGVQDAA